MEDSLAIFHLIYKHPYVAVLMVLRIFIFWSPDDQEWQLIRGNYFAITLVFFYACHVYVAGTKIFFSKKCKSIFYDKTVRTWIFHKQFLHFVLNKINSTPSSQNCYHFLWIFFNFFTLLLTFPYFSIQKSSSVM